MRDADMIEWSHAAACHAKYLSGEGRQGEEQARTLALQVLAVHACSPRCHDAALAQMTSAQQPIDLNQLRTLPIDCPTAPTKAWGQLCHLCNK